MSKQQNYDYSLTIDEAAAGSIEIDYKIRGPEEEAEELWMKITQLLKEHDEKHAANTTHRSDSSEGR